MSTSSRTPFIGAGTGRCGTNSLTRIIRACAGTTVSHEGYQLHWYEVNEELGRMIREFRTISKQGKLCGDVSQANGPHVDDLRASLPDLKVICLHRDKESTVESFMNYGSNLIRPRDKKKWADGCMGDDKRARAMRSFPLIDGIDPEQAYGFYWEYYESVMANVAEPVFHIAMDELNDDKVLGRLFAFLEIPENDIVYTEKRRYWTRQEVETVRAEMSRGKFV